MTSPQTDGLFERSPRNPILTVEDLPYPANAIFNPGAAQVGAETLLLVREQAFLFDAIARESALPMLIDTLSALSTRDIFFLAEDAFRL